MVPQEDLTKINEFRIEIDNQEQFLHTLTEDEYVNEIMENVLLTEKTERIVSKNDNAKRLDVWAQKQPISLTAKYLPFSEDFSYQS